jgi:hypothetical protein
VVAAARQHFRNHQVAVLCLSFRSAGDYYLLVPLFFLNRDEYASGRASHSKNAEDALLCAIEALDHAPAVADCFVVFGVLLYAQQRAIADACGFVSPCAWRYAQPDPGRRSMCGLIPFSGNGDEFAITIPDGDVRHHDVRQHSRTV